MNNKDVTSVQRMCSISKQKYYVNELIKITYSKKMNDIFINNSTIKGRSVYFKKDNILKLPFQKFSLITFGRLKITPNSNMIDQLKNFYNKEI